MSMMIPQQLYCGEYECDEPIMGTGYVPDWLWDELAFSDTAVNCTLLDAEDEYRSENGLADDDEIPDEFYEWYAPYEECYLIGDWKLSDNGMYDIVPHCNGCGYAAEIGYLGGAALVHVHWSETIRRVHSLCSPCCPGQADLDSGNGNIACYALPDSED